MLCFLDDIKVIPTNTIILLLPPSLTLSLPLSSISLSLLACLLSKTKRAPLLLFSGKTEKYQFCSLHLSVRLLLLYLRLWQTLFLKENSNTNNRWWLGQERKSPSFLCHDKSRAGMLVTIWFEQQQQQQQMSFLLDFSIELKDTHRLSFYFEGDYFRRCQIKSKWKSESKFELSFNRWYNLLLLLLAI